MGRPGLGATSTGTKRRLPKRLGKLIKSAVSGLEDNSNAITTKLMESAKDGNISSTKLLLELAEQETEESDDGASVPIEKTGWGELVKEPPYRGPGPSEGKTVKTPAISP